MKKLIYSRNWLLVSVSFLILLAVQCHAQSASPVRVKALKDNTNLRAKPALNVEVVGQVSANQELTAKSMDAEWVEVVAPANIDFWVLGDYLKDGVVVCRQAVNVRAGPGINFSIVGQLTNGVNVAVRGNYAEWIKIAPPEGCSLWIARQLVELVSVQPSPSVRPPPKPPAVDLAVARVVSGGNAVQADARKPEAPEASKSAAMTNVFSAGRSGGNQVRGEGKTVEIKPPKDLDLIPDIGQGQWKQFEGVLKTKNFLARSPSDFRLVVYNSDGQAQTVCFVKGNRAQLNTLLFRDLIVSGREYWVHRHRYPVLVPEKIIIK